MKLFKPKFQTIMTTGGAEITKKEAYYLQLEKLRVMLHFYSEEDFNQVVFHKLNTDQIL